VEGDDKGVEAFREEEEDKSCGEKTCWETGERVRGI
jgi:hypothetical protein